MAKERATLTLRIGDKEVRYEAGREAVEAQLGQIMTRLLQDASTDAEVALTVDGAAPPEPPPPSESASATPDASAEDDRLVRLYKLDDDGRLTLRRLPKHPADALLLVLYGVRKLRDREWVTAPSMTRFARASGVRFERADRLLAPHARLIEGTGNRRGKRYRLNGAGLRYCERLVRKLVNPTGIDEGAAARGED